MVVGERDSLNVQVAYGQYYDNYVSTMPTQFFDGY